MRYLETIPEELAGLRLDQALVELFPEFSRSRLQRWIKEGKARVDAAVWRPKDRVSGGERVELAAEVEPDRRWEPEAIPLEVVYADAHLLVLNKPAGLVVHPAAGNWSGTLVNGLLHLDPELARLPRAGIVHRLDKDTSGLMVVARSLPAQAALVAALQDRTVSREYEAICVGVMTAGGTVDAPLGRHPIDRLRMAVVEGGKPAVTHYRVSARFHAHTHVHVRLETGRTHQIRVHLAHIHFPLVGDPLYGGRLKLPAGASAPLQEALRSFTRQALHARRLALSHPVTGAALHWEQPPPADFQALLAALRADAQLERPR